MVAAVEAPLPYPGVLENGLVVDLAPIQELGRHVSFGVDLPRVDQVGDEPVLLLVGHGVTPCLW